MRLIDADYLLDVLGAREVEEFVEAIENCPTYSIGGTVEKEYKSTIKFEKIVCTIDHNGKPYYQIQYITEDGIGIVGKGSYNLDDISQYLIDYFINDIRHGHWDFKKLDCNDDYMFYCSECGYETGNDMYYCPYCGAKMDEVTEDNE